jgi:hypothetical protein
MEQRYNLTYHLAKRSLFGHPLRDTEVSDAGIATLKKLTKLRILNLSGTRVSDKGLAELKSLLSPAP